MTGREGKHGALVECVLGHAKEVKLLLRSENKAFSLSGINQDAPSSRTQWARDFRRAPDSLEQRSLAQLRVSNSTPPPTPHPAHPTAGEWLIFSEPGCRERGGFPCFKETLCLYLDVQLGHASIKQCVQLQR